MSLAIPELTLGQGLAANDLVASAGLADTVLASSEPVVDAGGDEGEAEVEEDDAVTERVPRL